MYFLAVTFAYYGFSRHRSPLNPVMMAFAGYAIVNWKEVYQDFKLRNLWQRTRTKIVLAILIFFIIGWMLEVAVDVGALLNLGFQHEHWQEITTIL